MLASVQGANPLRPIYWTDGVHQDFDLYVGPVSLAVRGNEYPADGIVRAHWLPTPRLLLGYQTSHPEFVKLALSRFGITEGDENDDDAEEGRRFSLVDAGFSIRADDGGASDSLFGEMEGHAHRGGGNVRFASYGETVPLNRVVFNVVNGPQLMGSLLTEDRATWRGRVILESDSGWRVTLDQRRDFTTAVRKAADSGGYAFTHVGEATRSDGLAFRGEDVDSVLGGLRLFLSIVSGAWAGPVLPVGLDPDGNRMWEDWMWFQTTLDRLRGNLSWFDWTLTAGLPRLFASVMKTWEDPRGREVLRYATSFYLGANKPRPVETALTLAVSGLELLAWDVLVNGPGKWTREAFEARGSARKWLKDLLDWAVIPKSYPPGCKALSRAALGDPQVAVLGLRNQSVHPSVRPRVGSRAVTEGWRLASWYLELCLLRWLDYQGNYGDRMTPGGRWVGETKPVPWVE